MATGVAAASLRAVPVVTRIKPRWITEILRDPSGAMRLVERLVH